MPKAAQMSPGVYKHFCVLHIYITCMVRQRTDSSFLIPFVLPGILKGSPTVAVGHDCVCAQKALCCSCLAWDGKYHWADLSGLFKRPPSICSYFTSSTRHNQGLDPWVNLQPCFNKQTPLLTGRVLLGEFQSVREQAEFVSMCS